MMYLTRITLNQEHARDLKLFDAYAWHQTLWQAFPNREGEARDFLSRVESRAGGYQALLLSPAQPTPTAWGHWEIKAIPDSFLEFTHYRFDLRVNPVISKPVRSADGTPRPRGRRCPIVNRDELIAWMGRKAESNGFQIDSDHLSLAPPVRQPFRKGRKTNVHTRVDFQGVLTVTDRDAFLHAFQHGIGPAKAFGFGMLMLQPIG